MILDRYKGDLIEYAESGQIDNVCDMTAILKNKFNKLIYRGMLFPIEWAYIGNIVEEWSGSTHWTTKEEIAKKFSDNMDADDFIEEYGAGKGMCSLHESLKLFNKTIFCLDNAENVLPLGEYLKQVGVTDINILEEDEVSIIGYDFVIDEALHLNDFMYCKVRQQLKNNKQ